MFYSLASSSWGPEELKAIQRVVDSGMFTMGENVKAFERDFAKYFGTKYGVMVNSGSSANLVAVASLFYKKDRPLQRGDEVIVPAISWSTTYHPLQQYGLRLKFIDVELDTLNIDVSKIEAAIGPRTRMILAVSILGNPAAVDVMKKIADKHGLYFMEDNCESMDAEIAGRKTGTFGILNTFSSFFSHHISTMEGGMVLTDDEELFHILLAMRNHGWTRDLPEGSPVFEKRDDDFYEAYRFILPGYNVRPIELSGAIGREQIKKLPAMTVQRRKNMAHFQKLFANDGRFIIQREHGKSSSFCFTIILKPERNIDRKRVFAALKKADIGYRIITGGCFLRHDVIKYYDYEIVGGIQNANIAHDYGFFVGNAPTDLTPQIDTLREVLDRACN
ncbi:MAG TPA: DegT/DnrJ/EryC1/StrS family aminotransferase [Reyranella sp.]|nr:DegT/DnrJ/EryC1/StrS family aminotransferase [Reyranella sp.]HTY69207.1 DegT/DnrJ/EryC1/StrS family aminotransferase [Alphaproteobacteria bacterium]